MNATQLNPKADLRMGRIQTVSKYLRAIMLAGLIVEGAAVMAEVFVFLMAIFHPTALRSQIIFVNFGCFVLLPVGFMATLNFFRLFTRVKDGHLFDGQTINYLEWAGKWWIAFGIGKVIYQLVDAYIFSPHRDFTGGDGIFSGLLVCFIAWVLREGQKLKEEQELTV